MGDHPEALGLVRARLARSIEVKQALLEREAERIAQAAERLIDCCRAGGKVLLFGNGGSASDAAHIAGELVGRFLVDRPPLAAVALADNGALVTAIGNDYGYEQVFARQVSGLAREGDVAIGISTSGRSRNVVLGLEAAAAAGARTIALTGDDPGAVGAAAELAIAVPSTETPRIQESHIAIGHIVCELLESALFA